MSQPDPVRPEPGPEADIDEIQTDIAADAQGARRDRRGLDRQDGRQATNQGQGGRDQGSRRGKAAETKERVLDKAHAVQHATLDDGRAKLTVPVAAVVVVGAAGWCGSLAATALSGYALFGTAVTSPPSMMNSLPVA